MVSKPLHPSTDPLVRPRQVRMTGVIVNICEHLNSAKPITSRAPSYAAASHSVRRAVLSFLASCLVPPFDHTPIDLSIHRALLRALFRTTAARLARSW